jgi:predicted hydrocarbon binding protein
MTLKNNPIIIFSTKEGMIALDSPIKLKIIKFIRNQSRSFEEIVEATCKAKSTVSVHLKDLMKQNIIVEQRDTVDRRKKYFTLNSQFIAYSQTPSQKNFDMIIDRLIQSVNSQNEFFKTLSHVIRYGLEAYGMNPRPVMKKIGNDIGKKMGELFISSSMDNLLVEIAHFWKEKKLGHVEISDSDPFNILVYECFDCSDMPDVGRTLCAMDEGIFEGIFETKLNLMTLVEEVECFGTGYDHCKFNIYILE